MKKCLLLASAWMVAMAGVAQVQNQVHQYKPANAPQNADDHQYVFTGQTSEPEIPSVHNNGDKIAVATPIAIGQSANIFSCLLNGQNQVAYNQDLNTIVFVHRNYQSQGTNSGTLNYDISTDGGFSWALDRGPFNPGYTAAPPSGGRGACRYPSVGIYNPTSNTDTNNAYIVANPPVLTNGPQWGYIGQHSVKLDGTTDVSESIILTTPGDSIDFHPYGLNFTDQGVGHSVSTIYNGDANNPARDTINYRDLHLWSATFNATNKNFDWTLDQTISPNWDQFNNNGTMEDFFFGGYNIAFAPNGQTGYMVAMGVPNDGLTNAPRPIVWKTTNGGTSWAQETSYDFVNNSVITSYLTGPYLGSTNHRPFFSEYDMVVDQNGDLHIFAEIQSGSSLHQDSLAFTYFGYKFLFHCYTTGANWNVHMVDSLRILSDFEIPSSSGNVAVTCRPQCGRNQSGDKVFFTWVTTDPLVAGTNPNNQTSWNDLPDVWGAGYDVNSTDRTPLRNFSNGTGANYTSFYATLSHVVKDNGSGPKYELPIVYADPDETNALNPPQYYYLKGAGFEDADFWPASVDEKASSNVNMDVYPNPSNGLVNVQLSSVASMQVTVFDIIGNVVSNRSVNGNRTVIDLGSQATGAYFIKVKANDETFTEKVILTR